MSILETLTAAFRNLRTDSLFVNSVTGLGGPSDPHATTGINHAPDILTPTQLVTLYRNNPVASRVCRLWANDCTKKGWYVRDPSADPDPMKDEDRRLMIQTRVRTALLFSCIFGAGYLLIITEDDIDESGDLKRDYNPAAPLLPGKLNRIVNLLPMTTLECTAAVYESDATNPNFGRPRLWSCTPYPYMENRNVTTHHTRVLYFPGTTLPNRERSQNRGADQSILQAGYDGLKAYSTVSQSVGTYVQRLNRDVFKIDGLNAIKSTDQAREFNDKMQLIMQIRSMLGMMVLDARDEVANQTAGISGFSDLSDHIKDDICAAFDTPRVVLFGESPGGLNSDGDSQRGSWQSQVEGKQAYALLPALTYLYRLIYAQKAGPFHGEIPSHFDIVFNPLHSPTADEIARIRKETAEMDKIYIECGVYTAEQVRRGRFGIRGWQSDLPPLTPTEKNTGEAAEVFSLSESQLTLIREILTDLNAGKITPAQARGFLALAVPDLPATHLQALLSLPPAIPEQAAASTVPTTDSVPLPTITLEYQQGEIRRGISDDGEPWESVPLPCGYGYLDDVDGLDGDEADVLQAGDWSGTTYVIEHRFPDGALDEYKCVIGAKTPGEALNLYSLTYGPAANYGKVHPVPDADLVGWLEAHLTEDPGPERTDAVPARYEHISFVPPVSVADEARRGLEWRREHGRGGTGVGVARARDLSNRTTISPQTVRRMNRYFSRHQGDKKGKGYTPGPGFPSAGRVAWALWGGDPGRSWAAKLVRQMNAADKSA